MDKLEQIKEEIDRFTTINEEYRKTWRWKFKYFSRRIIGRLEALEGIKSYIEYLEKLDSDK